jgi:hypothetical protein
MKKTMRSILTVATTIALVGGMATTADAETLGWSEDSGQASSSGAATRATVSHTGKAEEKTISGTTNKRSHGWTTWSGVYHYTRARLEKGSTINGDSGRVWGTSGTEAISPWKPYRVVGGNLESPGTAHTYYGN